MYVVSRLRQGACITRPILHSHSFSRLAQQHKPFVSKLYSTNQSPPSAKVPPSSSKKSHLLKVVIGSVIVGTGYALYERSKAAKAPPIGNPQTSPEDFLLKEEVPELKVARRFVNPSDQTGLKLTLFQYQPCPFCCKTRALLDYYGLSYDVIEVNSVTRTQVKWSDYKKVPILVAETPSGQKMKLTDSTMIISAMASFLTDKSQSLLEVVSCFPRINYRDHDGKEKMDVMNKYFLMYKDAPTHRTKEDIVNERKWRRWVDDELVHKLSPNVYRTPSEALQAFYWFEEMGDWKEHFATWERYLVIYFGALVMWIIGKRLKSRHHLKDDVRTSLYDDCNHWAKQVKKRGGRFMGGDKPNLADLGVYGVLSAIEGCDAFTDLMKYSDIRPWFEATKEAIQSHEGQYLLQGR
ncbi:hypothetical protein TCAL_17373 [Tigriopus californicus]|uniref:Glutaredoxin domain-containing protein n=1 Tax=Tigriopus californicus TaxID=6832 RepID=A0A553PNF5_TIGCA|nr:prostaglandin E synthase 2-like [Tigriopus californicus]TRY79215.1 hypothetical protein TCAL_17373 [Tigriopus californicus]